MPYNPGVTDRSGELLGAGISQAGSAIGGAIGQLGEDMRKARDERDFIRSQLEVMAQAAPGVVTQDMLAKAENGSLGAAKGIFTQAAMSLQRFFDDADDQRKMQAARDLEAFRSGLRMSEDAAGAGISFQTAPTGQTIAVNKRGTMTVLPEPELPKAPGEWRQIEDSKYKGYYEDGYLKQVVPMQEPEQQGPPSGLMSMDQRYREVTQPSGATIVVDMVTGERVSNSEVYRPKPEADGMDWPGVLPPKDWQEKKDPMDILRAKYLQR